MILFCSSEEEKKVIWMTDFSFLRQLISNAVYLGSSLGFRTARECLCLCVCERERDRETEIW